MNEDNALIALKPVLDAETIDWVLIGAVAANRYRATVRMTGDIDLLLAGVGHSLTHLEAVLEAAGWNVFRADPAGELLRLKHKKFGVADLIIAGTGYQQLALRRAITECVDGEEIKILTVEDVIIHKLIAGRFQDLADIEAILETQISLDEDYLQEWIDYWQLQSTWSNLVSSR
ncbi:MAG: nucleotidyltransferase [Proteobacteria bacterium]|nr:nucleotidyltransferase [Pseudomonadota bacterium]MDA1300561.1 nucleotidyltransferase [Pseudomonadota bacterium]